VIAQMGEMLAKYEDEGYVIAQGLLDPEADLRPVVDEYTGLLDGLARQWHEDGTISDRHEGLPFGQRLVRIASETGGAYYQPFDISLPQRDISEDTPMHHGPAAFNLLRNPKLLDAVEAFVGPEVYSNPVQHVRLKPPERCLPAKDLGNAAISRTYWHQDQGVMTEDADDSNILTVWVPITEATVENGCLEVVPRSHHAGLGPHCFTPSSKGLPEVHVGDTRVPLPMSPGDVLFMTRLTKHGSLSNETDEIRWSFDLRYSPIGQPTGRRWFPGFVARSRANPESELGDGSVWARKWAEARSALSRGETPNFHRWDPNDPMCA